MTINGFLQSFSLPELLRLIDLGSKSGRLIVQVRSEPHNSELVGLYHIWFHKGRLVTMINRVNNQSLLTQFKSRGWLSEFMSKKIENAFSPNLPLGSYLEEMNLLTVPQLKLLFQNHLEQMYQLFEVPVGWFLFHEISPQAKLDKKRRIPWLEMTGQSIRATEASLHALRVQKNWDIFADHLPESSYALEQLVDQPHFQLIPIELEVWKLANGNTSLKVIAEKTKQPLLNVKKVAFRLIMAGLVDEMPIMNSFHSVTEESSKIMATVPSHRSSKDSLSITIRNNKQSKKTRKVSTSFLKTVINFLKRNFK